MMQFFLSTLRLCFFQEFDASRDLTIEQSITAVCLLQDLLSYVPGDRPNIERIKEHPMLWDSEKKVNFIKVPLMANIRFAISLSIAGICKKHRISPIDVLEPTLILL